VCVNINLNRNVCPLPYLNVNIEIANVCWYGVATISLLEIVGLFCKTYLMCVSPPVPEYGSINLKFRSREMCVSIST